jgi:hypothetical protein
MKDDIPASEKKREENQFALVYQLTESFQKKSCLSPI